MNWLEFSAIPEVWVSDWPLPRLAEKEPVLRAWIATEPSLTLAELQQRLMQHGVSIKIGTLWHQLNKWSLTLKKNSVRQLARTKEQARSKHTE